MIKQHFKVYALYFALFLALWLDTAYPLTAGPTDRAEPFSLTALFISLALSAASFAINRLLAPKPPKVTRGQQTGEIFVQNADEGSPVMEIYGAAPALATTNAEWENLTNATINGDGFLENDNSGADNCSVDESGSGDSGASVVQTITEGDFEVTWTFRATDDGDSGRSWVGLTTGAFSLDYTDWAYTIHASTAEYVSTPHPINSIIVYEGATEKAALDGEWAEGDTLRIRCEGTTVTYWHKGTLIYTSAVTPTYPLRIVASMACFDSTVDELVVATPTAEIQGGIKTAGTIIWANEPRKVTVSEKQGGKGAPKQTVETITYYTDLAILFGRGRLRLKKLWANADLIVDLDAPINAPTGVLDPGAILGGYYDNQAPPPSGDGFFATWAKLLIADINGTQSGTLGAGGASMRWYQGNYDQLPDALIEADVGVGNAPAYRGAAYLVIESFNISKYGGIPTFLAVLENMDITDLDQIADSLAERVGIEPGDRDFSPFEGEHIRGLIVQEPSAPRQTLELASVPYKAEFYETTDGILTGTYFGGSSVVTIDDEDLGMMEGDQQSPQGQPGDKMQFTLVDEIQIPRQITVTAYDPFRDHETTSQHAYRMTGFSEGVEQFGLPMALSPLETRRAAMRLLYQRHAERENATIKLPWKYSWIQPTDIVTVVSAGITHRLRVQQITGAIPGPQEFQCVADSSAAFDQDEPVEAECTVEDVTWECLTFLDVVGTTLRITDGVVLEVFTSHGQSEQTIDGPGQYVTWKVITPNIEHHIGLSSSDCPTCHVVPAVDIYPEYCEFCNDWAEYRWYYPEGADGDPDEVFPCERDEGDGPCDTVGTGIVDGDLFAAFDENSVFKMLWNDDDKIEYYIDDTLYYTSVTSPSGPLRLMVSTGPDFYAELDDLPIAFLSDAQVYSCVEGAADANDDNNSTVTAPSTSIALLVDTVMFRDNDDAPGYYTAIVPQGDGAWSGAALYRDRGVGYELLANFLAPAVAGVLVSNVTPTNTTTIDEVITVTVDLYGTSATLEGVTELQMLNGANPAILGEGLIFQFRDAAQVGGFDNRWDLTGLLWGRRGSDWALGTINAGARFLLLDGAIQFLSNDLAERGIARDFKAVTSGFSVADTAPTLFTWDARTLKPLSVVDVEGERDISDNLTLTWTRRTRVGGAWLDYVDAPLSEVSEAYEIDVMDGVTVVRTITAATQTAAYSAADQVIDFGSPQPSLTVRVYQMSATVGRGFVREVTV